MHLSVTFKFCSAKVCSLAMFETCVSCDKDIWIALTLITGQRPWFCDHEMPSMHTCMQACVCLLNFYKSFISHLFMKISSPNLQRMFMATEKIYLKKFCLHFKK